MGDWIVRFHLSLLDDNYAGLESLRDFSDSMDERVLVY